MNVCFECRGKTGNSHGSLVFKQDLLHFPFKWKTYNPGCTVHADICLCIHLDIRLDFRKITDVRVELFIQPRIPTVNVALGYS